MIKYTEPGKQAGSLPIERVIQLGRKSVKGYPEKLTGMLVSFTHQDNTDAAGNRQVDHELMAVLLRRQSEIDPTQPSDLLRVMEVFLPPSDDLSGVFDGDFMCRTDQGDVVCRGDGETATWVHGWHGEQKNGKDVAVWDALPPFLRPVDSQQVCIHGATRVHCAGRKCPLFERALPTGKPAYPRCKAEWMLKVQIAVRHATFATARLRSTSIIGYDETFGVIKQLQEMHRQGRIPGLSVVPLRLILKNTRTKHSGKQGVWTVFLDHPGGAISMMLAAENTAREQRYLGVERPDVQAEPAADEFEGVMDVDDAAPERELADVAPTRPSPADACEAPGDSPDDEPADVPTDAAPAAPAAPAPNETVVQPTNGTFERVKALALALCEGDATRAKELMATVRDALRDDDPSFPTPRPGWSADAGQVALYEDALRAFAGGEV